jgi:thiol-disulfide isomerase/thioredoxin
LLALAASGCRCSGDEASEGAEPEVEEPEEPSEQAQEAFPEPPAGLEVVSAEALKSKLRASGRKGTLVNAWASFCGPCKREIPMLEKVAEKVRSRGLDVVLVSVDEPADRAKAEAFLSERGVGLTSYLAARPLGPFKQGMNPRWPGMLPASFLFDASGTLRYYWGGEAFEEEVLPVLEAFAAGRPIDGESLPLVAPGSAR